MGDRINFFIFVSFCLLMLTLLSIGVYQTTQEDREDDKALKVERSVELAKCRASDQRCHDVVIGYYDDRINNNNEVAFTLYTLGFVVLGITALIVGISMWS